MSSFSFTNGTLIDEEFCQNAPCENFVPANQLLEGIEAADGRRGDGVYQKVMHAMELLKSRSAPFGVSTCHIRKRRYGKWYIYLII